MKLNDLRPDKGSKKKRKRVGRGIAAGHGKTAGRGTKGQGARSGGGGPLILRVVSCRWLAAYLISVVFIIAIRSSTNL
jgi:hypothetical protein